MPRRLPPLNALPSFEAAARNLSFSRAADELHVTHGAVSRAVRNLEDHLGVQLMVRASRSVRLTPVGASFAAEIRDVLEHLAAATSAATGQTSGIVSVSTIDSFAARWLMPRLFRFRRVHGDIDVRGGDFGAAGRFRQRRDRHRNSLWRWPISRSVSRIADEGRSFPGVQSETAQGPPSVACTRRPRSPHAPA